MFKKIIIVTIANYKMNEEQNYKNKYKIINTKNLSDIFTDKVEIITLSLKKFRLIKKDLNNLEHLYLNFFDKEKPHKQRKEMGKMDKGLEAAVKRIEEAIQSDDDLRIYHKIELEKAVAEKNN